MFYNSVCTPVCIFTTYAHLFSSNIINLVDISITTAAYLTFLALLMINDKFLMSKIIARLVSKSAGYPKYLSDE